MVTRTFTSLEARDINMYDMVGHIEVRDVVCLLLAFERKREV